MRVQFHRFFLNSTQPQLFKQEKSKHEILSEYLGKNHEFSNRNNQFAYVFNGQIGDYIFASLGKKSTLTKSLPPETHFEEKEEEHWPHSKVYINIAGDSAHGQMIAIELNSVFDEPIVQLRALSDEINVNLTQDFGYVLAVNPMTEEKQFWDLVEAHKGNIREVCFNFRAPNLFGLENAINDELKEARDILNATSTVVAFKNEEGKLDVPKNIQTEQSVQYIAQGGGSYELKVKGLKAPITSKKQTRHRLLDQSLDIDVKVEDKETFLHVFDSIFKQ